MREQNGGNGETRVYEKNISSSVVTHVLDFSIRVVSNAFEGKVCLPA